MKRYGDLFQQIISMDNLRLAHKNARKGKGWYKEVIKIDQNPDFYLTEIQSMLADHAFHTSEYTAFYRQDGAKKRKIYKLPYYPDRIVQWAILQVISPIMVRSMTADTYSAIPDRGIHAGLAKVQHALRYHPDDCRYCLKLDVHHYYQSINHAVLKQKYRRLFKDPDLLFLLNEIIDSISTIDAEDLRPGVDPKTGIPIGNYLSQYSGNLYLSSFDHWLKEVKRVKFYFRYMDDMVIFGSSKTVLHRLFREIEAYLHDHLKLTAKQNWQVFPTCSRGVDFLGYRIFPDYTLLRKSTCRRMKRRIEAIRKRRECGQEMNLHELCSANSYLGWLKHCDSFRLRRKYFGSYMKGVKR